MDKFLSILMICWIGQRCSAIKILELKVPEALEIGTMQDVVLDCDFDIQNEDEEGLSVKWFYDGDVNQVYQWLPGREPQALGILKDRLDLKYKVSKEKNKMYRALKIKNVTSSLTGEYTCKVSSYVTEDSAAKKMIIYKPADEMEMTQNEESRNVTCSASGLYPEPDITMYIQESEKSFTTLKPVISEDSTGINISTTLYYSENQLPEPTIFVCEVFIPDTMYRIKKVIEYHPGGEPTSTETATSTKIIEDFAKLSNTEGSGSNGIYALPNSALVLWFAVISILFNLK